MSFVCCARKRERCRETERNCSVCAIGWGFMQPIYWHSGIAMAKFQTIIIIQRKKKNVHLHIHTRNISHSHKHNIHNEWIRHLWVLDAIFLLICSFLLLLFVVLFLFIHSADIFHGSSVIAAHDFYRILCMHLNNHLQLLLFYFWCSLGYALFVLLLLSIYCTADDVASF